MTTAAPSQDLQTISTELGFAPQHLFFLVRFAEKLYFEIEVSKRNSPDKRKIFIPRTELKGVQRAIYLNILRAQKVSNETHSYVRGRSVITAAEKIRGDKAVLRLDLKEFFPSIGAHRVFGLFRAMGYANKVAFILTRLTTFRGILCQGAPTSPAISNLICRTLDGHLLKLAETWRLNYLRYSDDLFFYAPQNFNWYKLIVPVKRIITDNGFALNSRKTRYFPLGSSRVILGLSTHGRELRLPKEVRRRHRAAFHRAVTDWNWAQANLDVLSGMAEWHKAVYKADRTYKHYREIIRQVPRMRVHEPFAI